jgi:uncharacterized protein YllA (UPF0747 family)
MIPRIVPTPIAPPVTPRDGTPRKVAPALLEALLPGPGRDRLATQEALVVTTGQQPGLFTGPLYTIYKALSAMALAARLEQERRVPVVPVFWVAGDDHDFQEANHATVLDTAGAPTRIVLRERPGDHPALPLMREPCGPEIMTALERLGTALPDSEFKQDVLAWLRDAYRPEASLADAFATAMHALLGHRGLAVLRPYGASVKREMAPWLLRALDITLSDGLTPVLLEGSQGRDRLRRDGAGYVTRRSGERFDRAALERIAEAAPDRLSPNVLLRPVVEAALLPTVAYVAGPGELEYLRETVSLYQTLGVVAQTPVPRWSGLVVEGRVERVSDKYHLQVQDFSGPPGALEGRLVREQLPADVAEALEGLRRDVAASYAKLAATVSRVDATLERTVDSARNAALAGTNDIEKKLVAALKRNNETLVGQLTRARTSLYPDGAPQERVLTYVSIAARYGPPLLVALEDEVARWAAAS